MPCSIAVCESGPCRLAGSDTTAIAIEDLVGCLSAASLTVLRTGCVNLCSHGPNAVLRSPDTSFPIARRLDRFPAIVALVRRGVESVRPDAWPPPAHVLKSCELHWTAINAHVHANYDQALQSATQALAVLDGCETADCNAVCGATSIQPHELPSNESEPAKAVAVQLDCLADGNIMGAFSLNSTANQVRV